MRSKTMELGMMILAFEGLAQLNLPVPRLLTQAAARLGVSRKAGYQAARRMVARLESSPPGSSEPTLRREVLLLRLRNQILTFERDHPGVRFQARGGHLPPEAKSLAVRILRDFGSELSARQIAHTLGVALSSLRRWDKQARADATFPERPEGRGRHRRRTPEDEARVVAAYQQLPRSMTLEEFTETYNNSHPPLDRRTITRILQEHHLVPMATPRSAHGYHGTFEVYFPGAQVAVDGTDCKVSFTGEKPETITVTEEVAMDLATSAILGTIVRREEDAAGVQRVLVQARQECVNLLAVLSDNGSANRAKEVQKQVAEQSEVGSIFSFPAHPRTNGHLEGLFGQFSRVVGKMEIDDRSRTTLAHSIARVAWKIFTHFHNHAPRNRLGGLSPLAYLRTYAVGPKEKERARSQLRQQQARSRALRNKHPRLVDPAFRGVGQRLIEEHHFPVELDHALRALIPFDGEVIERASQAFFVQSRRDGFDERKRTFAYFMGIVRNMQKEVDQAKLRRRREAHKTRKHQEDLLALQRQITREKAEEEARLQSQPDGLILDYARWLLSGRLIFRRDTWLQKLRRSLQAWHDLGRASHPGLEQLALTIRAWGEFPEALKEQMIQLLHAEYQSLAP